jgi:hypothetical protein
MTIQVDPGTGFKTFNTRAAATGKISGRGYAVVDDPALKDLPAPPVGAVLKRPGVAQRTTCPWKEISANI